MKKILVIEDNQEVRDNIAEILELASYQVLRAENGKEGIIMAMQELPDLILCDIMMPVLDGYGVLHMLKKNDSLCKTPFVFMSAKADRIDVRKGMGLGADDYLTKPLYRRVAEALIGVHEIYSTAIDMSRQNLAALAGTATESMIRTLNDFKSEKIIDINDGIITILNEKKVSEHGELTSLLKYRRNYEFVCL